MLTTIFLIIACVIGLLVLVGIFITLANLIRKGLNSKSKRNKTGI